MGLQHVYDAIKLARETGEAWVTWNGERLRLVPLDIDAAQQAMHFEAIVKARKRGGIELTWVDAYKDVGSRLRNATRRFGWDQVLVVVAERHPRETS